MGPHEWVEGTHLGRRERKRGRERGERGGEREGAREREREVEKYSDQQNCPFALLHLFFRCLLPSPGTTAQAAQGQGS